ncbi:MAG: hypothetical protein RL200_913 [Actinomycetota bacterium]
MADAFAVKVDVGLGGDGNVIDCCGDHGEIKGRVSWPHRGGFERRHKTRDFRPLQALFYRKWR